MRKYYTKNSLLKLLFFKKDDKLKLNNLKRGFKDA